MRCRSVSWLVVGGLWLAAGLTGCESLERKFTRKPRKPLPPPNPIIHFQDYTRAMTPLDRYRKHSMMFEYWNAELIEALHSFPINPKRFRQASSEALAELQNMRHLVVDAVGERLAPLLEERTAINRQLQSSGFSDSQATMIGHVLDAQTRQIHREFFWRAVEEQLKGFETDSPPEKTAAQPSQPSASTSGTHPNP